MKKYMYKTENHGSIHYPIIGEDDLRDIFRKDSELTDTDESFELWKKLNTDTSINPNAKFVVLKNGVPTSAPSWLQENKDIADEPSVIDEAIALKTAMEENYERMFSEDEDYWEEGYSATWTIQFKSACATEDLTISWGAAEYEFMIDIMDNLISGLCG